MHASRLAHVILVAALVLPVGTVADMYYWDFEGSSLTPEDWVWTTGVSETGGRLRLNPGPAIAYAHTQVSVVPAADEEVILCTTGLYGDDNLEGEVEFWGFGDAFGGDAFPNNGMGISIEWADPWSPEVIFWTFVDSSGGGTTVANGNSWNGAWSISWESDRVRLFHDEQLVYDSDIDWPGIIPDISMHAYISSYNNFIETDDLTLNVIPEPGTLALLALGAVAMAKSRRSRRQG